jgi:ribosomal protein L29
MSDKEKLNGSVDELRSELGDCQDALQNLVFQKSMQQLEDLSQIKKTRKKIARLLTLIHESKVLDNS